MVHDTLPTAKILCFANNMKIILKIKFVEDCLCLQRNVDSFSRSGMSNMWLASLMQSSAHFFVALGYQYLYDTKYNFYYMS